MSGGAKKERERERGQLVRTDFAFIPDQPSFLRRYFFRGSLSSRKGNFADERAPNLPRADAVFAPHRHPCCLVNLYNTASCLLFPLPKHRLHTIITTPWDYFVFLVAKRECTREMVGRKFKGEIIPIGSRAVTIKLQTKDFYHSLDKLFGK